MKSGPRAGLKASAGRSLETPGIEAQFLCAYAHKTIYFFIAW